ncbi:MAG: DNA polymerase III subunit alpha [Bacteroidia bacterium]|jgi:DNA polymerase-3 subunit alpha
MLLNCHTYYSFCYGVLPVKDLLAELQRNGYDAFVLSDINNTSACLDTIRLAPEYGLRPVVGIDFRNGVAQTYIGIARNNTGFRELNEHLSTHLHQTIPFEAEAPEFHHAYIVYPLAQYRGWNLRDHEFIGVSINDLPRLPFSPYRNLTHKLVVLHEVSFLSALHHNTHRLLRAIDTNMLLSKLPLSKQARGDEQLLPRPTLEAAYAAYPFIAANTQRILDDCCIGFEYGKLSNKNLKFYTGGYAEDMELLRSACYAGIPYRFPNPTPEINRRIEKELEVIGELKFASYFLINHDIVRYARHKNYYYVGRGSGANSILAYLLRITDVDPIELDLYFERFINIHRSNAPDFDIDFSWRDRDDITDYIFNRFGTQRTALLGAYNTFKHDAAIRELGKVFGLPQGEIEVLQKRGGAAPTDALSRLVLRYSERISNFPSHLSIHSSGILISEEPITAYSATFMPPKGFPTTQFSMLEAEDIGLYKFDILSQRGLGKIKDALTLVQENRQTEIDIHDTARFKSDEAVKVLLRKGNTIGCFYVESPAMRMLLAKLQADDYLRLVAASSIIRPGVAKSGMMREYILRFRNPHLREQAQQAIPELYAILEETYGVMVYQEDVIKVAHLFAGISLAEADYLRRGMSWKFKQRNEFSRVREHFFSNCEAKGYSIALITTIWNQIESFAHFAFSKGHSASYAVESYQALFLKAHFPLEYLVATLNNGGGYYPRELYVHEARMHGATMRPPCINNSQAICTIQDKTIFLGLAMISELEQESMERIMHERDTRGPFAGLTDFMQRIALSVEQMRLLIRAGCFDFDNRNRKELLWQMHGLLQPTAQPEQQKSLFRPTAKTYQLPTLLHSTVDEAFEEISLFGFPLACSPFELLREKVPPTSMARELKQNIGKTISVLAYLITRKRTITSTGESMFFGTFIDREGHWIDTVHFPPSAKKYPFTGGGCYLLTGKVTEEYDFISIEVAEMKRIAVIDREAFQGEITNDEVRSAK